MTSRLSRGLIKMNSGTIGGQSRIASPVNRRGLSPAKVIRSTTGVCSVFSWTIQYADGSFTQFGEFTSNDLGLALAGDLDIILSGIELGDYSATISNTGSDPIDAWSLTDSSGINYFASGVAAGGGTEAGGPIPFDGTDITFNVVSGEDASGTLSICAL